MTIMLWQLNTLSRELFVAQLGSIFEHSPWVADNVWEKRPFHSVNELHEEMMNVVREADESDILTLLCAHPNLASRVQLTSDSALEQQSAGLDALSPNDFERFSELNDAYMEKNGFPFIIAVRGKTKQEILAAMSARLTNERPQERRQALLEVQRIAEMRLLDRIEE